MNEKNIAITNDNRLYDMAGYWESKGNMVSPISPEAVFNRFTEFKGLVKRGSYTIEQLEAKVFGAFGIITPDAKMVDKTFDHALKCLDEMTKIIQKRKQKKQGDEKK